MARCKMMNQKAFVERNKVFEIYQFINTVLRVFGTGFYDLEVDSKGKLSFKYNTLTIIWCAILQGLFLWCSVKAIYCSETLIGFIYKSNIYSYSEHLETLISCLLVFRIVQGSFIKSNFDIISLDQAVDIKFSIIEKGRNLPIAKQKPRPIVVFSGLFILHVLRFICIYLPFMYWQLKVPYYRIVHVIFMVVYVNIYVTLYSIICEILTDRYGSLNNVLEDIIKNNNTKIEIKQTDEVKASKKGNKIYIVSEKLPETISVEETISECYSICSVLHRLNKVIDNMTGRTCVLHVLNGFLIIVFNMFYLIYVLSTNSVEEPSEILFFVFYTLLEVAFTFLTILTITDSCDKTMQEGIYRTIDNKARITVNNGILISAIIYAAKTPMLVSEIINLNLSTQASRKAEQLSMMLLYSAPKFTAWGLFTFDVPFLLSFIGSVTTYLIILLQISAVPGNESLFSSNTTKMGVATLC